ncbi:MAG: RnfABCDGE type electron transport complex subunit D [Chloroflexi bacterium]|nr:RnfABCDGE type electron transport complex subunit D [Chloroflexota bacterium]MBI3339421.1 RnfABCDGE type electron transport complex subunit D [Chloroflexota bacterium]
MIDYIDNQLNRITMYRLALYYLIALLGIAVIFSAAGLLAYDPYALLFSAAFLLAVSVAANQIFAKSFKVQTNVESAYITALILALIISPIQSLNDLWFLGWAAVLAMASKYILAYKGKHFFNPIAIAVALTYYTANQSASWWVGNGPMLPAVLLGGLLIVRKIGRMRMVLSFFIASLAVTLIGTSISGNDFFASIQKLAVYSPAFFFAFIILTEPLTTPPTQKLQVYYGALVGLLFVPQFHIGSFFVTPELAILIGNVFSYTTSPKEKLTLKFKEKTRVTPDTYEFVFSAPRSFSFTPGQYMEWTLSHDWPDSRGNRRYFTLASAPTERTLRLGVKFYEKSSSFKKAMLAMNKDTEIVASQLAGDFVLPQDPNQKCVLIAGGIGVTPFRSMIKNLLDTHQRRAITLFYTAKTIDDIIYKDVFDRAQQDLGIKTVITLTDKKNIPPAWKGKIGRFNAELIRSMLPDYRESIFYISGSRRMVKGFKNILRRMGIPNRRIKTDLFSGLM